MNSILPDWLTAFATPYSASQDSRPIQGGENKPLYAYPWYHVTQC